MKVQTIRNQPEKTMATLLKTVDVIRRIEMSLTDLIISSICAKSNMREIFSEMNIRVYKQNSYQKLPKWAKERIASYWDANRKSMVNEYIRIFYIGLDGRKIPTHCAWDSFTEEERSGLKDGRIRMVHLWLEKTIERFDDGTMVVKYTPTDKIYYESEMI